MLLGESCLDRNVVVPIEWSRSYRCHKLCFEHRGGLQITTQDLLNFFSKSSRVGRSGLLSIHLFCRSVDITCCVAIVLMIQ